MSFKTCLIVTALAVPGLLLGCGDPATQGTGTETDDTTDTGSTGEPGTTAVTEAPTTTQSVMTSDTLTTGDVPEGCADGEKNGDETDIDCGGGTCGACDDEAACVNDTDCKSGNCDGGACAGLPASCLALHEADPELPSGTYPLDPDGDGQPADFYCDMEADSPGWTQVFAPGGAGTWDPVVEGACGDLGDMMGPFGTGDALTLATTAAQVPHTELRVAAEVVVMDSWDAFNNEQLLIKLDDVDIFMHLCDSAAPFSCNQDADACGDGAVSDGLLAVVTEAAAHDGDAVALTFTSNLDEPIEDESWGLREVAVFVK